MPHTCSILVLDGVAESAVGITLDVLGAARRVSTMGLCETGPNAPIVPRILSLNGNPVRSSEGRSVAVDGAFTTRGMGRRHIVIVPGLGMATPEEIEQALDAAHVRAAVDAIGGASARGATLAASCSATFLLGAAGVLDGLEATTT